MIHLWTFPVPINFTKIKLNIPIKNDNDGNNENYGNDGNWDDLPKLRAGSDIRIYSDGDYYHSIERFCNTKKIRFITTIQFK